MGVKLGKLKEAARLALIDGLYKSDQDIADGADISLRTFQTAKAGHSVSVPTANKIVVALKKHKISELQTKRGE